MPFEINAPCGYAIEKWRDGLCLRLILLVIKHVVFPKITFNVEIEAHGLLYPYIM